MVSQTRFFKIKDRCMEGRFVYKRRKSFVFALCAPDNGVRIIKARPGYSLGVIP